MKDGSVIKGIGALFVRCGMRPLALAFGEFDKIGDSFGGFLLKQAANDVALAGFQHDVGSGCARHSLLVI